MSEKRNVPMLRFPGFDEEWSTSMLGDVVEITSASRVHKDEWTEHGVPFYRSSDVVAAFNRTTNTKAYISLELYKSLTNKTGCVKKDDLLVTGGGSIGIPFLIKTNDPFYFKDADLLWLKNTDKISGYFLHSFFTTQSFKRFLRSSSHIGTIAHYTVIQAKNTPFQFPSLPEQQKIANFLTAVDRRIELLQQKKEKLERYKKGVMQQLFTRKIRFKTDDGSEFPDWEEKKLGEVANIKRGASPRPISDPKWFSKESDIGWVRISDVTASGRVLQSTTQYLTGEGVKKSRWVKPGSIIMSICATIGKPVFTGFEVCIHDGFVVFENLELHQEYLYFYLIFIEKSWYKYGQPGTQVNLNTDIVNTETVPVPSFKEQESIVQFLRSLETSFEALNQQINQSQTWKKGLLQQMFV